MVMYLYFIKKSDFKTHPSDQGKKRAHADMNVKHGVLPQAVYTGYIAFCVIKGSQTNPFLLFAAQTARHLQPPTLYR